MQVLVEKRVYRFAGRYKLAVVISRKQSQTLVDHSVGAGLEYGFAPNWSAKVECLYAGYGSESYFSGALVSGDVQAAKVGLAYRFGGHW